LSGPSFNATKDKEKNDLSEYIKCLEKTVLYLD
jgi:hypothetical protein